MVDGCGSDSTATTLEASDEKYHESPIQRRPELRLRTVDVSDVYAQAFYLRFPWASGNFASPVDNDGGTTTSNRGRLNKFTEDQINGDSEEGMDVGSSVNSYRTVHSRQLQVDASELHSPHLLWRDLGRPVIDALRLTIDGTVKIFHKFVEYGCVEAFCIGYSLGGGLLIWSLHAQGADCSIPL
jgi:hypothetical protein